MHNKLNAIPKELESLKESIQDIYYLGNTELLNKRKFTIIGSRKPNPYAQALTKEIANKISKKGGVIVSGGALGIDILAHISAMPNTIMVSPSSLDIIYPKANTKTIKQMQKDSLLLSQFSSTYTPHRFSFLERNKLVVSLGELVIIPYADMQSGSMQSARYAISNNIPIYVFPHRMNESKGTSMLIKENLANVIWDIDEFIQDIFGDCQQSSDEILEFCKTNPFFEDALLRFGDIIFEYELDGKIIRSNGRIEVV